MDEIELSWIAVLLLSYRKDQDLHATSEDFADLQLAIDNFIWDFEAHSPYELENRDDLIRNLMTHCKALLFRKTYGILSKNPLTRHILQKYPELYHYTEQSVGILEEAWLISLTRDEIAYLAMHLGGALKPQATRPKEVKQIYIVCDEGWQSSASCSSSASIIFRMTISARSLPVSNLRAWKTCWKWIC